MGVGAGRLDRRIELKSKSSSTNGLGEREETLLAVATVWAQEVTVNPRERHSSAADQPFQDVVFRIRRRPDLNEDMVFETEGWRYEIEGIKPDGHRRRQWLLIYGKRIGVSVTHPAFLISGGGAFLVSTGEFLITEG